MKVPEDNRSLTSVSRVRMFPMVLTETDKEDEGEETTQVPSRRFRKGDCTVRVTGCAIPDPEVPLRRAWRSTRVLREGRGGGIEPPHRMFSEKESPRPGGLVSETRCENGVTTRMVSVVSDVNINEQGT